MELTEETCDELCTSWLRTPTKTAFNEHHDKGGGENYYNIVFSPEWSKGMCCEISESLSEFLNKKGIKDATTIDVKHIKYKLPHTVVKVGNIIIDFTYRQFEEDGPVPNITTVEEYKKEFEV